MKKALSLLLVLMLFATATLTACSAPTAAPTPVTKPEYTHDSPVRSGNYTYEKLTDGTIAITNYHGLDAIVKIPSRIDGLTVTFIGERAFFFCSSLESVTIPNSVTSIGR